MLDFTTQILIFLRVADDGSFSAAGRELELSTSAVSRQVRRLEDHLGIRLLNRSPRGISLTGEGEIYYQRASVLATQLKDLETMAMSLGDEIRGPLRVCSTVAFAKAWLLPVIGDFLEQYQDIELDLELMDRPVDFQAHSIDVAIRFSEQIDDDSVIARKLAPNRRVICAAPEFLERHGIPESLDDLANYNCLQLSTVSRWNHWTFNQDGETRGIQVDGNLRANSADAVYHAALEGLGIARLSTYLIGDDIRCGRLKQILPDYVDNSSNLYAVYPDRHNLPRKVSAFVKFLLQRFQPAPPWECREESKKVA